MTVAEKINTGAYDSNLPFPTGASSQEDWPRQQELRRAYREDTQRLIEVFKADLIEENGFTGHPKANALFNLAWGHGHANGFQEVASYFEEFMILLERVQEASYKYQCGSCQFGTDIISEMQVHNHG